MSPTLNNTGNHSEEKMTPSTPPVASTAWFRRLARHLVSDVGLSSLIALLSIALITGILSIRFLTQTNLSVGGTSSHDIVATKTLHVEDLEETNRIRYEARQHVAPIYKEQANSDRLIIERLVDLLSDIAHIREQADLSPAEKLAEIQRITDSREPMPPVLAEALVNTTDWKKINETTLGAAQALVERGITSEEYRLKAKVLIRQSIDPAIAISSIEESAVVFLIQSRLKPTLMVDEQSTEEARDIAGSHIKPVIEVFAKGDLIVRKGDRISALQQAALEKQGEWTTKNRLLGVIGVAILTVSLMSIVWSYLYRFEHHSFFKPAYAGLLATVMVAAVAGMSIWIHWLALPVEIYMIAILALVVCIFTHPRIAILTTMMVLLLCGLTIRIPLESLSVQVFACMVGIFTLSRKMIPKDRHDVILAGLSVGAAQLVAIMAIHLIEQSQVVLADYSKVLIQAMMGFGFGLLTGIVTLGLLPILEAWFKLVTPFTLLELGNHDRPILRRMQLEAPGTFHHSLMVASLSEAAAEAIGANPILTRVGALYHDIGKIKRPLFFVENQAYFGVENPHDKLTPRLSKMVITAHPRDGIEMGKQLGLPKTIMRFMPEHHGTLVAGYFYNKAVLEEGEENVVKDQFRYPGPKPHSKETAIVMMADACESAVRALKNPTLGQVEERVDKIIKQRIDDHQFTECPITLAEIEVVRNVFIRVLKGIQHNRIEYQQNVLEELGAKSSAARTTLQPPVITAAAASGVGGDPLIELESLRELQDEENALKSRLAEGPDCC